MKRRDALFQLMCAVMHGCAAMKGDEKEIAQRCFRIAIEALKFYEEKGFLFDEEENDDADAWKSKN